MRTLTFFFALLIATSLTAHPGSAIAVSKDGRVLFVDTGAGVFSIDAVGRLVRQQGPAFHWFAFDPNGRFQKTPFPSPPGAEFRSAGNVVLSSDFPVAIGSDGRFYYPEPSGKQIRIVGLDPSGARHVRATITAPDPWINGLAAAADGSLYYTEDRAIRRIDAQGRVTTIVEKVTVGECTRIPGDEGDGPYLRGLAIAGDGSIYVAAAGCGAVLKVDPKRRVSPVLKSQAPWSPTAIAIAGDDVYVLEYLHTASDNRTEWLPRIRKISRTGVTTLSASTQTRAR